jgi:hypothetical protein
MFTVLLAEFSVLIVFIHFFGIDFFTMLNSAIQLDLNFNSSRMNLLDKVFVESISENKLFGGTRTLLLKIG